MNRILLSPPDVGDHEREALLGAFDSNWIAPLGPEVDRFEEELALRCDRPAAAALSSGTAALHLSLLIAGVKPGDRVLVPSLTFVASVNAVRQCGAVPVLVDAERETWGMDPTLVADYLGSGRPVAAVMAVDLFGQCAKLEELDELCNAAGVPLIEDAAEGLGASRRGRPAGAWGRMSVLSFNGNKVMTTSGGGALLGDEAAADRARFLGSQARQPARHYEHVEVGYNYRLSNLLAALGRAQLSRLDTMVDIRRNHNQAYRAALGGIAGVGFMPDDPHGSPTNWLTVMTVDPELSTPETICARLDRVDVEARPCWKPMHRQPVNTDLETLGGAVADELFATGVCLPSGSGMSVGDRDRVIDALRGVLDGS